jgi:hypothetical protein
VEFVNGDIRVPAQRRFKTVAMSSAGYPLDKTCYQTIKGMVTPLDILVSGGALISLRSVRRDSGQRNFAPPNAA